MQGHDPERTNRSPTVGPDNPHLAFTHARFLTLLAIGPDGTVYGCGTNATLVSISAGGQTRWIYPACVGEAGGIAPNGNLLTVGWNPPAGEIGGLTDSDTAAIAFAPDGTIVWRIQPFGQLKGAEPVISRTGKFYVPIIGHVTSYFGLNVIAGDGKVVRRMSGCCRLALGHDGTIYAASENNLAAISPRGKLLWERTISTNSAPTWPTGILVGLNGRLYADHGAAVSAYNRRGRRLWRVKGGEMLLNIAQRTDGVVLLVGTSHLSAVSVRGKLLWTRRIGTSKPYSAPSIAVDGAGKAYVGTPDGDIRIFSDDGAVLTTLPVATSSPLAPSVMLGPAGRLVVTTQDNVLRVYD